MAKRMIRWTHAVSLPAGDAYQQSGWCPPVDVYRLRDGWLIKFELAGVRPEEIHLSACGRVLTLRGSRHDWVIGESQSCYSMEISYNRFQRSIELPCDVEHARLESEYRDGMLLVRISPEGSKS